VGGQGEIAVDVRVVALTLRDLRRDAGRGLFRLDLYHRLAGCELRLPPLRERRSDIALLALHFLEQAAAELGPRTVTPEAMERLSCLDWPGNARELRNTLRRAAALVDSTIDCSALGVEIAVASDSTCELRLASRAADAPLPEALPSFADASSTEGDVLALHGKTFREMQTAIFCWALRRNQGSRRRAAQTLGISRSTFCDRVRKLGLSLPPGQAAGAR
jgi:two-component system nitrogen regulation response regulator GlnG